jgi:hypothetical protein
MDFHRINIHAGRREHQYCALVSHKPSQQMTTDGALSRLQYSFLSAVRSPHIDADPLSEPHFTFTLSAGTWSLQVVEVKSAPVLNPKPKIRKKRRALVSKDPVSKLNHPDDHPTCEQHAESHARRLESA